MNLKRHRSCITSALPLLGGDFPLGTTMNLLPFTRCGRHSVQPVPG